MVVTDCRITGRFIVAAAAVSSWLSRCMDDDGVVVSFNFVVSFAVELVVAIPFIEFDTERLVSFSKVGCHRFGWISNELLLLF